MFQKFKTLKMALKDKSILKDYIITRKLISRLFSDETFLKIRYKIKIGKPLNLENPKTFNEKLQWLKLYDRKPEHTMMVDKYLVREYVAEKIGSEYLVPLLGVWDNAKQIDFDALPEKFVLKCNHDSGGLVICKDKSKLDRKKAVKRLNKCLKRDFYSINREWPYKNVNPKIICEEFLSDNGNVPDDYKVLCFNGEPKLIQLHKNRYTNHTQDFYDIEWNKKEIAQGYNYSDNVYSKPEQLEKMLELSRILSEKEKHARIDWYVINGNLFFGEITFFDGSGFAKFYNDEHDLLLGSYINLGDKIRKS